MTVRIIVICGECGNDEFQVLDRVLNRHQCVRCGSIYAGITVKVLDWMRVPY